LPIHLEHHGVVLALLRLSPTSSAKQSVGDNVEQPVNLKQDRRQWLKTSATVLGASLFLPAVAVEASQAKTTPVLRQPNPPGTHLLRVFHSRTAHAGRRVVETIIPQTATLWRQGHKVVDYIEQELRRTP
jgi:hypothetical protein